MLVALTLELVTNKLVVLAARRVGFLATPPGAWDGSPMSHLKPKPTAGSAYSSGTPPPKGPMRV